MCAPRTCLQAESGFVNPPSMDYMRVCVLLVCRYDGMLASYPYCRQEAWRRKLRKRENCDEEKPEKVESRGCAGAGVYKWACGQFAGDVFDGEWKDDKMHGRGTREGGGRRGSMSGSVRRV
jgi:hypothetical protein